MFLVLTVAVLLTGCFHPLYDARQKQAIDALFPHLKKVEELQAERVWSYDTGPLEDGWAIHFLNRDATFWVKDDIVYAVDDKAAELVPNVPRAPEGIDREAVIAVAR